MLVWQGSCLVHDEFKAFELELLKRDHPPAKGLVHPESPEAVTAVADEFIVATDSGILHKVKMASPGHVLRRAQWESRSGVRRPWAWLLASERGMGFWCG
jgi:quinolinate synthase